VFNCLRRPDDVSFGGGVFVIVRCKDGETWQLLKQKGHIVGKSGRYACIYLPYHLMGLETPMSIFSAVLLDQPTGHGEQRPYARMVARAERDFKAGEALTMGGHHHTIQGAKALLVETSKAEASGAAPFYLAANKRLLADVKEGSLVPVDALDLEGSALYEAWRGNPSY
jgi:predicted homoserine dehydrogenase-like protein